MRDLTQHISPGGEIVRFHFMRWLKMCFPLVINGFSFICLMGISISSFVPCMGNVKFNFFSLLFEFAQPPLFLHNSKGKTIAIWVQKHTSFFIPSQAFDSCACVERVGERKIKGLAYILGKLYIYESNWHKNGRENEKTHKTNVYIWIWNNASLFICFIFTALAYASTDTNAYTLCTHTIDSYISQGARSLAHARKYSRLWRGKGAHSIYRHTFEPIQILCTRKTDVR